MIGVFFYVDDDPRVDEGEVGSSMTEVIIQTQDKCIDEPLGGSP
jgi:hypothetical protein